MNGRMCGSSGMDNDAEGRISLNRKIHKRTWTPFFEKMLNGEKNSDIRLADFDVEEGDTIIFEEWNPQGNENGDSVGYTGRSITRVVDKKFYVRLTDFWSKEEIDEKGVFLLELSENKELK